MIYVHCVCEQIQRLEHSLQDLTQDMNKLQAAKRQVDNAVSRKCLPLCIFFSVSFLLTPFLKSTFQKEENWKAWLTDSNDYFIAFFFFVFQKNSMFFDN